MKKRHIGHVENEHLGEVRHFSYRYFGRKWYGNATNRDGTSVSTYSIDLAGRLSSVVVGGPRTRTVSFTNDLAGQVLARTETPSGEGSGAPKQYYWYANGTLIGSNGNNGNDSPEYAEALNERTQTPPNPQGAYRLGAVMPKQFANFDMAFEAVSSSNPGGATPRYTVRTGDTLEGIAALTWGDASLWYMIAQANGLSSSADLRAGMQISIPAGLGNVHNNASTFKAYDANVAQGDLQPDAPKPKKKDKTCAQILVAVVVIAVAVALQHYEVFAFIGSGLGEAVAIAVTAATVGQGLSIATGLQEGFSWKAIGIAILSAGIGAGVGEILQAGAIAGSQIVGDVIRAAVTSVATQGVAVATGLQKKFSWVGVAASAAAAGIGGAISRGLSKGSYASANEPARTETRTVKGEDVSAEVSYNKGDWMPALDAKGFQIQPSFGAQAVSGVASVIAGASTRSLLEGSSFGDNILAALPDVVAEIAGAALRTSLPKPVKKAAKGTDTGGKADTPAPVKAPEPGQSDTGNDVARENAKKAEEEATKSGDIVVTAQRRATRLGAPPVRLMPFAQQSGGGETFALSAGFSAVAPVSALADRKDTFSLNGKEFGYDGTGKWKDWLFSTSADQLNGLLTDWVSDIAARQSISREAAEFVLIGNIKSEFQTADANGNLTLTADGAWDQYTLSSKLMNLDATSSAFAVRMGYALDPGKKAGAMYVTEKLKENAGNAWDTVIDVLDAFSLDPSGNHTRMKYDAAKRTGERIGAFAEGVKDGAVWVGKSVVLNERLKYAGSPEEAQAVAAEMAQHYKGVTEAGKLAVQIGTDAYNGNGFAQGFIAAKSFELVVEALVLRGAGKALKVGKIDGPDPRGEGKLWTELSGNARDYVRDIAAQTGIPLGRKQRLLLMDDLRKNSYTKLSKADAAAHRAEFNKVRTDLIKEWEAETGQKWPTYAQDVYDKQGGVSRRAGTYFDAHHVINSSHGGPNKWWNLHPARYPDQHQGGIHTPGGPNSKIFGKN